MCTNSYVLRLIHACGILVILAVTAFAQQPNLLISFQSTSLVPSEPLLIHVEVINPTANQEVQIPGRWEELVQIEKRCVGDKHFILMSRWWRPQVVQPPLPNIVLKPGSCVAVDMAFYPFDREGKSLFDQEQSYEVRASLNVSRSSTNIVSSVQELRIAKPSTEDADAIAALNANNQLRFCLLPEQIAYETATEEGVDAFVATHGKSTLGKYISETIRFRNSRLDPDQRVSRFWKEIDKSSR